MKSNVVLLVIIFSVFLLWEIVFASSNITVLADLELLYIIILLMTMEGKKKNAWVFLFVTTFILEPVNHEIIGLSLISFSLSSLIIIPLGSMIHVFDKRRLFIRNFAVFLMAVVIKSILGGLIEYNLFLLNLNSLLVNAGVFCITLLFFNIFRKQRHGYQT